MCGDDGQTYGNACMAHFFFCNRRQGLTEVAYDGECLGLVWNILLQIYNWDAMISIKIMVK